MIKNKKEIVMIITGVLLIAFAVTAAAYNYYCNACAAENIQKVIPSAEKIISVYNDAAQTYTKVGQAPGSAEICKAPGVEINGNAYIGILEIPSLNLILPILSDSGNKNLDIAPCGSSDPTNLIIEGKNYASHFGQLDFLSPGDQIIFTDFLGRVYEYRVSGLDTVYKCKKIKSLNQNHGLTLIKNIGFGFDKSVIYCDRL